MVRAHALPIAFGFSSEGRGFGSGAIGGEGEKEEEEEEEEWKREEEGRCYHHYQFIERDMGRNSTKNKDKIYFRINSS